MPFFEVLFGIVFIIIAIFRSKHKENQRFKKAVLSVMALAVMNAVSLDLAYSQAAAAQTITTQYLGFLDIDTSSIPSLANASLIVAFIALLIYLFSDTDIEW